jgi:hypothetical protein
MKVTNVKFFGFASGSFKGVCKKHIRTFMVRSEKKVGEPLTTKTLYYLSVLSLSKYEWKSNILMIHKSVKGLACR